MRTITLLIAGVSFLTGCGNNNAGEGQPTEAEPSSSAITLTKNQIEAAGIELGRVEQKVLSATVQINGVLDVPPQNMVTVSAPMGGFVKSTKLLQGMKIKRGEALVTLENQDYIQLQQDYLDNHSKLDYLKKEYERQQELAKENVNSGKVLQQSKSQYESAVANDKGLAARLSMLNIKPESLQNGEIRSYITLYSPTDGFVTQVNVNVGQFVNATEPMFKIVNLDHIHVELQVYEKDIRKIKIGQKISFKIDNEEKTRTGSVYLIGKEISPERTVRVHCHLDQEDESLLPGMFVTASLATASDTVDALPSSAIVSFEGKDIVFVSRGVNEFSSVDVITGGSGEGFTEVKLGEGFDKSSKVVVKGAFELLGLLKNKPE